MNAILLALGGFLVCSTALADVSDYLNSEPKEFQPQVILKGAISPFDKYYDGYGNPGASGQGYINIIKLDIGMVTRDMDPVLENIVSYDRAEVQGAYIGQLNMIAASSFNGINGLVWGLDLAMAEEIANNSQKPWFTAKQKGRELPVYNIAPLLDAGERLFGSVGHLRYPIMPGAMTRAAIKSYTANGPTYLWSAIALSIAKDRTKAANLFIEDAGQMFCQTEAQCQKLMDEKMKKVALSAIRTGDNSKVEFKKIYLGYKIKYIPEGYTGTAITAAPYVTLARDAIPKEDPTSLLTMTISKWEKALGLSEVAAE